jgi:hypothetical protein
VSLLERVVKVREKLAEDHPSRLASQYELAIAYQVNRQIDEVVELLKHVVALKRSQYAEIHPLGRQNKRAVRMRDCASTPYRYSYMHLNLVYFIILFMNYDLKNLNSGEILYGGCLMGVARHGSLTARLLCRPRDTLRALCRKSYSILLYCLCSYQRDIILLLDLLSI